MPAEKESVSDIIKDIQQEIDAMGYANDAPAFEESLLLNPEEASLEPYTAEVDRLEHIRYVNPHPNAQKNIWPVRVFKKIVQKIIQFYVVSVVEKQNEVNHQTANCLGELGRYLRTSQDTVPPYGQLEQTFIKDVQVPFARIKAENEQLQAELYEADQKIKMMTDRFAATQETVDILCRKVEILELENRKLVLQLNKQRGE